MIVIISWEQLKQNAYQQRSSLYNPSLGQRYTVIKFKIDTWAHVIGILEMIFKRVKNTALEPSCKTLKGPLPKFSKGYRSIQGTQTYQTKTIQQDIFVFKDLHSLDYLQLRL